MIMENKTASFPAVAGPDVVVPASQISSPTRQSGGRATVSIPSSPPVLSQFQGESDRAFEALRVYLELGPRRRYPAVARQVGASLRTVKRWAADFDWRGRVRTHSAACAAQFAETERAVQRDELLDAAARARAFRARRYALAEDILDAASRYLDRMTAEDLDQMSFADACKALEVASRIGQQAADQAGDESGGPARSLRDQLAALLDQACRESPPAPSPQPMPATSGYHPEPSSPVATASVPNQTARAQSPISLISERPAL